MKQRPSRIYILSAKYGLLHPNTVIAPYEQTLNNQRQAENKKWADMVKDQMLAAGIRFDEPAMFLCGENYRKYLAPLFKNPITPTKGLSMGKTLQFYRRERERKPQ